MLTYHIHTEVYSKLNLRKEKWFVINYTNSDKLDGFLQVRNEHPVQLQATDEYFDQWKQ